ncbi:MAG: WD40 repeat domain-containing protein, partial [Pseudomonadota bacterium]
AMDEPPLTLIGHGGTINDARWSADGRRIITASQDGTVRVWDPDTPFLNVDLNAASVLQLARSRSPRELTPDEIALYGIDLLPGYEQGGATSRDF